MEKTITAKSRRRSLRFAKYAALVATITIVFAFIVFPYLTDNRMKSYESDAVSTLVLFINYESYYSLRSTYFLKRVGYDRPVTEADLGELLFVLDNDSIRDMPKDEGYAGSPIYEYKPVDSRALLVVDKNGQYELFGFNNFITHTGEVNKNDGANILAVYNLNSPDKIKNIEIVSPYERNVFGVVSPKTDKTITDPQFISRFLNEFREMTDASSDFFDAINQLEGPEKNIDAGTEILYLRGAKDIIINLQNGLFLTFSFYPALGYIAGYTAAYELPEDLFGELLKI